MTRSVTVSATVRDMCGRLDVIAAGVTAGVVDPAKAGREARDAAAQALELFVAGSIDRRGASSIHGAARKVETAVRSRAQGAQGIALENIADAIKRSINELTSIRLPADQFKGVADDEDRD